jgi:ubiquinone/menaquinone biosynthesis C-methylase UbiE
MSGSEAAFDSYALSYDADFTHSSVGTFQRKRVWRYLEKNISSQSHSQVLELNCGTGEDALWFSQKRFTVTATDISEEMTEVAKEKLKQTNATVFQSEIQSVDEKLQGKKFNLIFSDFGGMNCLSPEELQKTAAKFSRLLHPNGHIIFVIMGRNCRWEQFYFKRKKDLKSAYRRRSKEGIEAIIFEQKFSTWYYSPAEMKSFFSKDFSVKTYKPIGIALPPSYLDNYFRKHPLSLKVLNAAEKFLGNFSSLSDKADHYIIDFAKK